jgi:O-acetyl-ADP-ribose deacetylase (regulator of RNase III)
MLNIVTGNILSSPEQYIAHQCNCVSYNAAGIAQAIFTKWSYADCYSIRWEKDKPGTIEVRGDGKENRYIINMFAQFNPGKPHKDDDPEDGYQARKQYFVQCMKLIKDLKPRSVAFPMGIGCGLAGGSWDFYKKVLEKFSSDINMVLYQIPEKKK